MSHYISLKVEEVIKETDEAVTLVFEKNKFSYKPGQFLTLIFNINGENLRRSYSLCTAPEIDERPAVTVKKVANGKVSNYIFEKIKSGDIIEAMLPMGTFTSETNPNNKRNIILIGAGSGITPLMGIAKSILEGEPGSKVGLVFGNRSENTVIFKKKLEELIAKYSSRFSVLHILSQPSSAWTSHKGRLNQSEVIKLLELLPSFEFEKAEYFICGPEGMMEEAQKALQILKVPQDNIRKESFVSSTSPEPTGKVVQENQSGSFEVTVIYQGTEYKFQVPPDKSILETALDMDIDLPYSCQSGMCTACMGKCVSGKVHLNNPDGLSDKEIEKGFVLTCVGHPVTADVVIEID